MCMLELSIELLPGSFRYIISFLSCLYGPLAHGARSRRVELLNEDATLARRRDTRRTATGMRREGETATGPRCFRARARC